MLKARLSGSNGEAIVVLGITRPNVIRLMQGDPILVDLAELDAGAVKVVIAYGEDMEELTAQLRELDPSLPTAPDPRPGESFRYRPKS